MDEDWYLHFINLYDGWKEECAATIITVDSIDTGD